MKQHLRTPADINLDYQDVNFTSSDGTSLHGWLLPGKGKITGTILFFHGNAENISTHIASVYWLPEHGYNVFLFDYRGYGKSSGDTDLDGIILDAEAAIHYITSLPNIQYYPIIVYGQSIGAAIASYAVAHSQYRNKVDAIILESTFSSYQLIAKEKLASFWLTWPLQIPLSLTISDRYKPITAAPLLSPIPVLFVYSKEDRVIPYQHGQMLFEATRDPKKLWLINKGKHIGIFLDAKQKPRLLEYLESVELR